MHNPALAHQCLGRPLTDSERALAQALEAIYGAGTHDFDAVAAALNERGVLRPSGDTSPWTRASLEQELRAVNASLDDAYARNGLGA